MDITEDKVPVQKTAAAVLRQVREQMATYDPVDKLLQLQRELFGLEQQYGITSAEFYRLYALGEMGDAIEIVAWAGRYRLFVELRNTVSEGLNQVVAFPM